MAEFRPRPDRTDGPTIAWEEFVMSSWLRKDSGRVDGGGAR